MNSPDRKAALRQYIVDLLGEEKAKVWWTSQNPMFGGVSPAQMLRIGKEEKVYRYIEQARESNGDQP